MKRPNKNDYNFNDVIDGVKFAADMIAYADYLETLITKTSASKYDSIKNAEIARTIDMRTLANVISLLQQRSEIAQHLRYIEPREEVVKNVLDGIEYFNSQIKQLLGL